MTVTDSRPGDPPRQDEHRLSRSQRKAIVAGAVGNTVEWVDWAVYATFAPIFADRFFLRTTGRRPCSPPSPSSPSVSSCARSAVPCSARTATATAARRA